MSLLLMDSVAGFVDLLFPPKCLVCGAHGSVDICEICKQGFANLEPPFCQRCGVTTDGRREFCDDCHSGAGWYFAQARAAGHFSGPLRQAVLALKYREKRRLGGPLGAYLAAYLSSKPFDSIVPDIIVPVPLHRSKLRDRGFNQAQLIAQEVSKAISIPMAENILKRNRRTQPQAGLYAEARIANIRDAFSAARSPQIDGKTVLLVDDVITTMHTIDEAARVLVDAGAKSVLAVSVARGM